jgi:hypothetical protein
MYAGRVKQILASNQVICGQGRRFKKHVRHKVMLTNGKTPRISKISQKSFPGGQHAQAHGHIWIDR